MYTATTASRTLVTLTVGATLLVASACLGPPDTAPESSTLAARFGPFSSDDLDSWSYIERATYRDVSRAELTRELPYTPLLPTRLPEGLSGEDTRESLVRPTDEAWPGPHPHHPAHIALDYHAFYHPEQVNAFRTPQCDFFDSGAMYLHVIYIAPESPTEEEERQGDGTPAARMEPLPDVRGNAATGFVPHPEFRVCANSFDFAYIGWREEIDGTTFGFRIGGAYSLDALLEVAQSMEPVVRANDP